MSFIVFWLRVLNLCFASSIRSYGFRQTPLINRSISGGTPTVAFASITSEVTHVRYFRNPRIHQEFMRVGWSIVDQNRQQGRPAMMFQLPGKFQLHCSLLKLVPSSVPIHGNHTTCGRSCDPSDALSPILVSSWYSIIRSGSTELLDLEDFAVKVNNPFEPARSCRSSMF